MPVPNNARLRALPKTVNGVTPGQRVEQWADLVDSCEEVLLAGLRRKVGPDGDVQAAYQVWYARQTDEHERTIRRMLQRLNEAERVMPGKLVFQTLKHVWEALEPLQFPLAVMGGVALSAWEYVRSTQDVDLLIGLDATNPDVVIRALQQAGLRPKHQPVLLSVGPSRFMQLIYEPPGTFVDLRVDLLLAESEYQRQALARRVPVRFEGMDRDVFVVSCEDLILFKLLAGRIRDTADVVALLEANRSALDFDYLGDWIPRLAVEPEWDEAWRRGFPGQPPPVRQ